MITVEAWNLIQLRVLYLATLSSELVMALQLDNKVEGWSIEEVKQWVSEKFSEELAEAFEFGSILSYVTMYLLKA